MTKDEPLITYVRISSSFDIVIDNHAMHQYYCKACGALVLDRFVHNQKTHKSNNMVVENEMSRGRGKGSTLNDRAKLREIGKNIKIIGDGKK